MMHPNGRRLLVQSKDNTLRMLDLRMVSITQRYVGALNFRQLIKSDITPCGSFVFSGSEDGCAYVWNMETGDQVNWSSKYIQASSLLISDMISYCTNFQCVAVL